MAIRAPDGANKTLLKQSNVSHLIFVLWRKVKCILVGTRDCASVKKGDLGQNGLVAKRYVELGLTLHLDTKTWVGVYFYWYLVRPLL